jgi:hypothetical protein
MITTGLFSLLLTWWSGPIDTATGLKEGTSVTFIRLGFVLFATRDITPVAYAAFGFALGVAAGLLIRRTVPAMAVTLVIFVAVQIGWAVAIRPHLIPPAHTAVAPLRLRDVIAYQPASRFWAFQWYEAGIFLALAGALAGWSAWWLGRHRVT